MQILVYLAILSFREVLVTLQIITLNSYIYELIIKKKLDRFTLAELGSEFLQIAHDFKDEIMVDNFILQQLTKLQILKVLIREENIYPKGDIYCKSPHFYKAEFIKNTKKLDDKYFDKNHINDLEFITLINKKKLVEKNNLTIIQSEITEYEYLMKKYPTKRKLILSVHQNAEHKSNCQLGKIKALENISQIVI